MLATKNQKPFPCICLTTVLTFNILHTSTEQETNMLPTTLDEAGSNRSNDLQVESGSYITLYKIEAKETCEQTII